MRSRVTMWPYKGDFYGLIVTGYYIWLLWLSMRQWLFWCCRMANATMVILVISGYCLVITFVRMVNATMVILVISGYCLVITLVNGYRWLQCYNGYSGYR